MVKNNQSEDEDPRLVSPYQKSKEVVDSGTVVSSFFSVVFEMIKTVIVVGLLALMFRIFIVQPFIVDGKSMTPTLSHNDYLLIDKLTYRLSEPDRGDIIVFHYPKDPQFNYIKRIIGLPGEKILVKEKTVIIYNVEHPAGFELSEDYLFDPDVNQLLNNRRPITMEIPDDQYFVMGDNRGGSSDSRTWGLLPKENIIGRSLIRLFPLNHFAIIKHDDYN